MVYPTE